jgi:hypothetical protein
LEKQYQRYLSLPQQHDENHICEMIHCFEKTYGRYFDDTAEYWREKDKIVLKEITFAMDEADKEKEIRKMDNLDPYVVHEPRASRSIIENFPRPPDKDTTGPVPLKYKSLIKTNFRTRFNYEDNEPKKEKEKDIEDLSDLNIINNDGESIIDNNSLLSTQKREPTDEEIKELIEIILKNGRSTNGR